MCFKTCRASGRETLARVARRSNAKTYPLTGPRPRAAAAPLAAAEHASALPGARLPAGNQLIVASPVRNNTHHRTRDRP